MSRLGVVSRRQLLKGAAAAAATATLQPLTRAFGTPALLQAAKNLTIAMNAEVATLDPHTAPGAIVTHRWLGFLFDQLVYPDVNGKILPMLATDWKMDGTTWKFTLRPNVKYHDGTVMTAKDAAYSLNRLLGYYPNPKPSPARTILSPYIKKVEASGDLEITITTNNPEPVLPVRLSSVSIAVLPQAYVESKGFDAVQKQPIGAGPYKLVSYTPGDRMVLERHADYWGGVPAANQLTVRLIAENATRIAALLSGEVDFITTVPPDLVSQVESGANIRLDQVLLWNYLVVQFNTAKGSVTNVDLRRALSLAIDRSTIIKELWSGRVGEITDYWLPQEIGFDPTRKPFAYDLDAAKKALAASGYNGEEIPFNPPSVYYNNGRLVADAINEMWKALGINTRYEPMDTAKWIEQLYAGNLSITLSSYGSQAESATEGVAYAWLPGTPLGQYYKPRDEYLKLALDAASSTDTALREKNYRAMSLIVDRDVPISPLYRTVELYGVRKDITWEPHPYFFINLRPGKFNF